MTAPRYLITALAGFAAASSCRPSATVERTTPVANLQFYRSVAIHVAAGADDGQPHVTALEMATIGRLREMCSFETVATGQAGGADLILDLNIRRAGRGGEGFIQNENLATLDVLLVMSDGVSGDLVGSATIRGKSSGIVTTGAESPEDQAVAVVAKTVGEMLGKSGCQGPRIARPVEAGPADAGPVVATVGDAGPTADADAGAVSTTPDRRAEAEAKNDAGKQKFRAADLNGALADFRAAAQLQPDARFTFNICLAHEALEQWTEAVAACDDALALSPPATLAEKIRARLAIIRDRSSG